MRHIREIIKEHLLLEKRIAQITRNISVNYLLDVRTTPHSDQRSAGRNNVSANYNNKPIENKEIEEVINMASKKIAEDIAYGVIMDGDEFVVKSLSWELAIAIKANKFSEVHWELIVKTVFRESSTDKFRTGKDQIVIEVN